MVDKGEEDVGELVGFLKWQGNGVDHAYFFF
jgi:hypothetical protein